MKRLFYILPVTVLCFFVIPSHAKAAISFNTATSSYITGATTATLSFTEPGGTNDYMVVGVYLNTGLSSDRVSSIAYNGSAMTLLRSYLQGGDYMYVYGLAGPTSGAHNLVITTTIATNYQTYTSVYSGVAQTGQPDALASSTVNGGSATTLTTNITTIADQSWLVELGAWMQGGIGAGTGAFFREAGLSTGSGWFDSNGAKSVGANSIQITGSALSGGIFGYAIVVSLAPAVTATTIIAPVLRLLFFE